ncbi:beta-amylase 7-like [Malus sylvestris]|uniref:beta-amylase 7-like n=1 Tax=Malus sylvestris TaxID=3752 RepID=UPI0021AC7FD1|nr:beta-amylase 7-like [Malus sylvestris]
MEMDLKEEDDGDNEDGEKHVDASQMMAGVDGEMPTISNNNTRLEQHHQFQEQVGTSGGGGARRCRPMEEKERTKLREWQHRAITARILAGLRRHGIYNLRVRADINDVIAALAREAGWVVLPDGTRFPSKSQELLLAFRALGSLMLAACNTKGVYLPSLSPYDLLSSARSQGSSIVGDGAGQTESHLLIGGSMYNVGNKQWWYAFPDISLGMQVLNSLIWSFFIVDIPLKLQERDFSSTAYIPVYVMLPLGVINMKCELVDPDGLLKQLRVLKSVNVDGFMVDCWSGIVERHAPQEYNWNGYKRLFQMVRELKLKLQTVYLTHEKSLQHYCNGT